MIVCLLHLLVFLLGTSLESSDYVGVFVCRGFLAFCAAGHATELFADFVVGHGELWSAQMLAATVSQVQNSLTTPSPLHCSSPPLSCMNSLSLTEQKFKVFILTN
jgi:hypothetical protein